MHTAPDRVHMANWRATAAGRALIDSAALFDKVGLLLVSGLGRVGTRRAAALAASQLGKHQLA